MGELDRYDRMTAAWLAEVTPEFVKLGVFDGTPDTFFKKHFVAALGKYLRREMPSEPARRKPVPKKVVNGQV